jgi:predicted metal-dependent phosphoesterase TrpH
MAFFANCHLHSDISDSFLSPEAIVDIAKEIGTRL